MKKLIAFLLLSSLRQRIYSFETATDAWAFAVQFEGTVEIIQDKYIVVI